MQSQITPTEEWRPVLGYEGWYEVSSAGRVRRVKYAVAYTRGRQPTRGYTSRVLKPKVSGHGYPNVSLSREAKVACKMVHSLVCEAFHGPRPEGYEPHHKNGNRLDPRADNVEWITRRENRIEPFEAGRWKVKRPRYGENSPTAKLTAQKVLEIRGRRGENARELASEYGVNRTIIYDVWNRTTWKHV